MSEDSKKNAEAAKILDMKPIFLKRLSEGNYEDKELILEAFQFSEEGHRKQIRKSGEPYINHPIRVALRCMDYSLDSYSIIGALTHDLMEDVAVEYTDMEKRFGTPIAELVRALTKVKNNPNLTVSRIFTLARKDFRVLLVKLFDRLDNLEDVEVMHRKKQRRICMESATIYSNVAYSLGLKQIYEEIITRSYRILYPKFYLRTLAKMEELKTKQEKTLRICKERIQKSLERKNAEVLEVFKHAGSLVMNRTLPDHALSHYQILTENPIDCYTIVGILHSNFSPIPLNFRDYISNPKANGKKYLETKILMEGQPVTCEITTREFHKQNDLGIVHLIREGIFHTKEYRMFLELYAEAAGQDMRLQSIIDLTNRKTIQILTPGGDCHEMRHDCCVLDFAFQVHTDLGLKCTGAIIDNSPVSITRRLYDGDVVRILTGKDATPDKSWEGIVKSPKAKKEIHKYFRSVKEKNQAEEL